LVYPEFVEKVDQMKQVCCKQREVLFFPSDKVIIETMSRFHQKLYFGANVSTEYLP
jgi:hypothetical protein